MDKIKSIFMLDIPYWKNKRIQFDFYWLGKRLKLTIWEIHKLPDYDDNWYTSWWKHITLWKQK